MRSSGKVQTTAGLLFLLLFQGVKAQRHSETLRDTLRAYSANAVPAPDWPLESNQDQDSNRSDTDLIILLHSNPYTFKTGFALIGCGYFDLHLCILSSCPISCGGEYWIYPVPTRLTHSVLTRFGTFDGFPNNEKIGFLAKTGSAFGSFFDNEPVAGSGGPPGP